MDTSKDRGGSLTRSHRLSRILSAWASEDLTTLTISCDRRFEVYDQIVVRRGPRTSSPLSYAGPRRRRVRVSAAVLILSFVAALQPSLATARSRATCDFQLHVQLSSPLAGQPTSGTIHATRLGQADCAGTLANQFVDGTGWVDGSGSYSAGGQTVFGDPGRCWLNSGSFGFFASPPVFLSNRRFVRMSGTTKVTSIAGALVLSGSGRAGPISPQSPGSEPITYTGVGDFHPDRGQSCTRTPITSGTLSVQFVVTGPR